MSSTLKPKPGPTGETSLTASRLTSPVAAAKIVAQALQKCMSFLDRSCNTTHQGEQSQGWLCADLAMQCILQ